MMSSRYAAEVERLRAALRGTAGRALLRTLGSYLASLPVAALAADNSSRYIAANAHAEELTGYSVAELAKMTVADLTPVGNTDDGTSLWEEFISSGEQRGQYDLRRRDGSFVRVQYWAYASIAPGVHLSLLIPETRLPV